MGGAAVARDTVSCVGEAAVARDTVFCVWGAAVVRDTLFCVGGAAVVRDTVSCVEEAAVVRDSVSCVIGAAVAYCCSVLVNRGSGGICRNAAGRNPFVSVFRLPRRKCNGRGAVALQFLTKNL